MRRMTSQEVIKTILVRIERNLKQYGMTSIIITYEAIDHEHLVKIKETFKNMGWNVQILYSDVAKHYEFSINESTFHGY